MRLRSWRKVNYITKNKSQSGKFISVWIITGILVCITALLLFFYFSYIVTTSRSDEGKTYDRYYVMITDDSSSSLWKSVYKAASEAAKEENAYVEMLSDTVSKNYSTEELMEIAIASKADGIIISADESEKMTGLINAATENDIPVVTVFSDNPQSERISFVGVGNYNLGREYGNLIRDLCAGRTEESGKIKVTILVDANMQGLGQNVLCAAIQEAVEQDNREHSSSHSPIEVSLYTVDDSNAFSVEESVRNLFLQDESTLPDIVVCLNEIDTTSVYQTVVDYNEVGRVSILGYYDSEAIIKAIERRVIYATASIDTRQLGEFCIAALSEYYEFGNTSQYFSADIAVIDQNNVKKYLTEEASDEE